MQPAVEKGHVQWSSINEHYVQSKLNTLHSRRNSQPLSFPHYVFSFLLPFLKHLHTDYKL